MILSLSETRSAPPPHSFPEAFPNLDLCVVLLLLRGKKMDCTVWEQAACRGRSPAFLYTQNVCFPSYQIFFLILVLKLHRTQENKKKNLEILRSSVLLTSITPLGSLVPVLLEVIEGPAGAYRTRGLLGYPLYAGTHLSSPCFSLLPSRGSQLPTGAT